jgi:hypothetical protein
MKIKHYIIGILTISMMLTACSSSAETSNLSTAATSDAASVSGYSGASSNSYYDYGYTDTTESVSDDYSYEYDEYDDYSYDDESNSTNDVNDITLLEEKLVYKCDLSIETTEYDSTISYIKDTISKYNGIIQTEQENDSSYNWYYSDYVKTSGTMSDYLEVRVPSEDYSSFIDDLGGTGKIVSKTTNVENISQEYYDTSSSIEALKIEQKRLLEMMESCTEIDDMIAVEQRLSEVESELSKLTTNLKYMDTDVAYSYVNISVEEVIEYGKYTDPVKTNTFIDRLKNTFTDTWEGFLKFLENLLFLIINLIPYAILILVLMVIYRKLFRNKVKILINKRKEQNNSVSLQDINKTINYVMKSSEQNMTEQQNTSVNYNYYEQQAQYTEQKENENNTDTVNNDDEA